MRGISFGNFLIKQVVEELKARAAATHPLRHPFAGARLPALAGPSTGHAAGWRGCSAPRRAAALSAATGEEDAVAALHALLADGWWRDPAREAALRPVLLRLAATYLTRPNAGMGGIDPVARFHLGNGARLERVNWLGNVSDRGMTRELTA